jgi:secreted trypsin-like serine protease
MNAFSCGICSGSCSILSERAKIRMSNARSDDRVTSISIGGYRRETLAAGADVIGRSRNSAARADSYTRSGSVRARRHQYSCCFPKGSMALFLLET